MAHSLEGQRIVEMLDLLSSNVAKLRGVHLLSYGSLRYGSLHPESDGDFLIVVDDFSSLDQLASIDFFQTLFLDSAGHGGSYGARIGQDTPLALPIEYIQRMKEGDFDILQVLGSVNLDTWMPKYNGILPRNYPVEFYVIVLDKLKSICLEPGGIARQLYLSRPNEKGAGKFEHRSTRRLPADMRENQLLIPVEQDVEFVYSSGAIKRMGNGSNGTILLEEAVKDSSVVAYSKTSYGLPRVKLSGENNQSGCSSNLDDPILIGVTGDKILSSMAITSNPSDSIISEVLIPSWERVAEEFFRDQEHGIFACLLQRSYKFSRRFIEHMQGYGEIAKNKQLIPEDLMFPNTIVRAYTDTATMTLSGVASSVVSSIAGRSFGRLGDWYRNNHKYKYEIGDIVTPNDQEHLGYGCANFGVIRGHVYEGEIRGDCYLIEMTRIENADWMTWKKTGKLVPVDDQPLIIKTELETHFKSNVDIEFKKLRPNTNRYKLLVASYDSLRKKS